MRSIHILVLLVVVLVTASLTTSFFVPGDNESRNMETFHKKKGLKLVEAFPGLNVTSPTNLIHSPNENRLYISEKSGLIYSFVEGDDTTPEFKHQPAVSTFMNIQNLVSDYGEMGLLGLAFNPDFPKSPYFYVYYVYRDTKSLLVYSVLSRFQIYPNDPETGDPASELKLLVINQPFANHNGGSLFFAEWDGCLYLTLGDGGGRDDPSHNAQNPNSLLGKVLRLNVNHEEGYSIPKDNPFVSGGALPEIFALGFRNPRRCSTDEETKTILCGDEGESYWEEVNLLVSGKNYGSDVMEGPFCTVDIHCRKYMYELPLYYYPHPEKTKIEYSFNGSCIIGGYIYRGNAVPWLQGAYIFGDFVDRKLGAVVNREWQLQSCELLGPDQIEANIIGFGVDKNKELYILFEGSHPIMKLAMSRHHHCGDGIIGEEEECDFGDKDSRHWKEHHCDKSTCHFTPSAQRNPI